MLSLGGVGTTLLAELQLAFFSMQFEILERYLDLSCARVI